MKHMTADSSTDRPTFSTAAHDILTGNLPLFGTLTEAQKDAGTTACAIVAVDWSLPGCLAIAVLRNRRMTLVGSYQADTPIFWGAEPRPVTALNIIENSPVHDLLSRFSDALSSGDFDSVVLLDQLDPNFALTFVEAFTQHEQAA
jgi:hypothetical protein